MLKLLTPVSWRWALCWGGWGGGVGGWAIVAGGPGWWLGSGWGGVLGRLGWAGWWWSCWGGEVFWALAVL